MQQEEDQGGEDQEGEQEQEHEQEEQEEEEEEEEDRQTRYRRQVDPRSQLHVMTMYLRNHPLTQRDRSCRGTTYAYVPHPAGSTSVANSTNLRPRYFHVCVWMCVLYPNPCR